MRPETIAAWTQLYVAVGLLAAICSGCALLKTIHEIRTGVITQPAGACPTVELPQQALGVDPDEIRRRSSDRKEAAPTVGSLDGTTAGGDDEKSKGHDSDACVHLIPG